MQAQGQADVLVCGDLVEYGLDVGGGGGQRLIQVGEHRERLPVARRVLQLGLLPLSLAFVVSPPIEDDVDVVLQAPDDHLVDGVAHVIGLQVDPPRRTALPRSQPNHVAVQLQQSLRVQPRAERPSCYLCQWRAGDDDLQ